MPAHVSHQGGKWRVVDATGLVKNNAGTAVDGGGHANQHEAQAQANAINASQNAKAAKESGGMGY